MEIFELSRRIRFCINPFLDEIPIGANGYAGKPAGLGLSLYIEMALSLIGPVEEKSGFVINVNEIDHKTRQVALPIFIESVRRYWRSGQHISLLRLVGIIKQCKQALDSEFLEASIDRFNVNLTPFRKITLIGCQESMSVHYSEKFEFAAMHKLWNSQLNSNENYRIFGKCANPNGHGHNYVIEVTVIVNHADHFDSIHFSEVIDIHFISHVDHKNLNADVPFFSSKNPTMENIAKFAWDCLCERIQGAKLHRVTIWESDRTSCSYDGIQS